jgi:hypothetical protein
MSEADPHPEFSFPVRVDASAIPAEYRALYHPNAQDGSMELLPEIAKKMDNSGLQTALQKERGRARELEKRAKDSERHLSHVASAIGAATPDEMPAKIEELLGRASPSAADAVRAEITESFKRTYGAQLQQKDAETAKLRKTLQTTLIDGEATKAIAAAKGMARALLPHVTGAMKLVEEDGELRPRVTDARGEVRYTADGLPMTASDLVNEMRQDADFAGLFTGSGSSGSGARGAGGGSAALGARPGTKSYRLDDWKLAIAKAKPDERQQLLRDKGAGKIVVKD